MPFYVLCAFINRMPYFTGLLGVVQRSRMVLNASVHRFAANLFPLGLKGWPQVLVRSFAS